MSAKVFPEATILTQERAANVNENQEAEIQRLNQRLDILDDRLDNIDSIVSAVAERVMSQLVTVVITCPHCGKEVEVAVVGSQKPRR